MGVMDDLQGATTEQKRAALAALAAGGQRGLDAFKESIGNVDSGQQTAMNRVQGHGSYLGDAATAELGAIVAQPGDAARVALQRQLGSFQADNQARQQSTGAYFDQVSAAIPLSKQFGDNEIGLARQAAQAEAARKAQQQQWEEEQHRYQMESLARQAEIENMRLEQARLDASGAGKDPFTDAQKAKFAQAQTDEERIARLQAEVDARADAARKQAELGWTALRETPNEMSPEDRNGMTADRAERTNDNIVNARKAFGWTAPTMSALQPTGVVPDRIDERNAKASGGRVLPALASAATGFATQAQAAAAPAAQPQVDWRAAAQNAKSQADAAVLALMQQLEPYKKVQAARDQYVASFGDDPVTRAKAILSNPYPKEEDLQKESLDQAALQRQLEYFNQTGYRTPQEQAAALNAENTLATAGYNEGDVKLAKQLGLESPGDVQVARQTPAYQAAEQIVGELVSAWQQGDAQPPTENMVRQALITAARESGDGTLVEILPLYLSDLKARGLLFSDAYSTNADTIGG